MLKEDYFKLFSEVLQKIKYINKTITKNEENIIVKKERIMKQAMEQWKEEKSKPCDSIIELALSRNRPLYVTKELFRGVFYELVDRVLNAFVGRSLKKHREIS